MNGKILVTGATGHLGANLVRRLLGEGADVRVLLRPGESTIAVDGLPVERVVGDLRSAEAVNLAVSGASRVFHVAAMVSTVRGDPAHRKAIFDINVLGTKHVLDAALKYGVSRVVMTGSFSAVGYDPARPERPSNEEMPFDPFHSPTPYSTSKAAAEHQCWQAAARGLDVVVAVSCAIVGPNDFLPSRLGGVLCAFAAGRLPCYIDGGFPWVTARDVCEGHVLAMERGRAGERYILASEYRTMRELLGLFEEVTGRSRPFIRLPPPVMAAIATATEPLVTRFLPPERHRLTPAAVHILTLHRRADTSKARHELGYELTPLRDAVQAAYDWFAERGAIRPPVPHALRPEGSPATVPDFTMKFLPMIRRSASNGAPCATPSEGRDPSLAPSFTEAKNRRQKARSAGLDPRHWYPVEHDKAVLPGSVHEVTFWGKSYALFREAGGELHVVENRCAHRQLRLSAGAVEGCHLVCAYHGWRYDGTGRVVEMGHELFGRTMPRVAIEHRAVAVRYGLIWVFFGDPAEATTRSIPTIPELEGKDAWPCVPLDFTWRAHHSIIIDNVSDFTHEYLHRRYRPFTGAKLTECRSEDGKVFVSYDAKIGAGPIYEWVVDHGRTNTNQMRLCYEYPFQWSNTDDKIKHHLFVLPVSRDTTRAFFLFYYDHHAFKLPLVPLTMPRRLMRPLLHLGNALLVRPLLAEDGFAVEEEQQGYERHFDAPAVELNPAIAAFQNLTVEKWTRYLEDEAPPRRSRAPTAVTPS